MTLHPVTPPQHPAESRRAAVERQQSVQDGVTKLRYFLHFTGAGQQVVDVNFPCRFIDKPFCPCGFDVEDGTALQENNLPWASAGALFRTQAIAGHLYFVGARVMVVMGGTARQHMTVHWGAEGKAIVGPVTETS